MAQLTAPEWAAGGASGYAESCGSKHACARTRGETRKMKRFRHSRADGNDGFCRDLLRSYHLSPSITTRSECQFFQPLPTSRIIAGDSPLYCLPLQARQPQIPLAKQASCNDAVRPNPPVQIGEVISDHILMPDCGNAHCEQHTPRVNLWPAYWPCRV